MAIYRQIHVKTWRQDEWFLDLPPLDKLLFIYLFSNESASVSGLYEALPIKVMAFETGMDAEYIEAALARFAEAGKVYYEGGWIWVVNLRKYNATSSPTVLRRIASDLADMPEGELKTRYIQYYDGIDMVSIPPGEQETEQEQEIEQEQGEQEQEQEKETLSSASADYHAIRQRWIELFPDKPVPRENNTTLSGKVRTRMGCPHFKEHWEAALQRASRSKFIHSGGWFDLSWFLKNGDNWEKCFNGNYDDKGNGGNNAKRDDRRPAPLTATERGKREAEAEQRAVIIATLGPGAASGASI